MQHLLPMGATKEVIMEEESRQAEGASNKATSSTTITQVHSSLVAQEQMDFKEEEKDPGDYEPLEFFKQPDKLND